VAFDRIREFETHVSYRLRRDRAKAAMNSTSKMVCSRSLQLQMDLVPGRPRADIGDLNSAECSSICAIRNSKTGRALCPLTDTRLRTRGGQASKTCT